MRNPIDQARWQYRYFRSEGCGIAQSAAQAGIKLLHSHSWLFMPIMLLVLIIAAHASDKAPILNDQEQSAYRAILDTAVRANGLSPLSRNAFILSDKLDQAGTVTERKTDPPPNPEPKPSEGQP